MISRKDIFFHQLSHIIFILFTPFGEAIAFYRIHLKRYHISSTLSHESSTPSHINDPSSHGNITPSHQNFTPSFE